VASQLLFTCINSPIYILVSLSTMSLTLYFSFSFNHPATSETYSLSLHDALPISLFLARDRFGIKPLYVTSGPWGIGFASELKALHVVGLAHRELDWDALDTYFQLGYIPAPATPFRAIRKLEPGHTAVWNHAGGLSN